MITFDPVAHTYTVDGIQYPSVTQILMTEGFIDTSFYTEWGRDKGKLAHLCVHLDDTGELDESTVDPVLAPYLDAYRRFKRESGFIVAASEWPLVNPTYRFAGTIDKIGTFKGINCSIIDVKTGAVESWAAIQLAAYEILKCEPHKRFALQLKADGNYKLHPFTDRQDKHIFLSALAVYQWKYNQKRRAA
jgi:hypothetical protein